MHRDICKRSSRDLGVWSSWRYYFCMADEAVDAHEPASVLSCLLLGLQVEMQEYGAARRLDLLLSQCEHQASSQAR